jgi:uncharacterized membrane protein YkvA (DUF1232 family)
MDCRLLRENQIAGCYGVTRSWMDRLCPMNSPSETAPGSLFETLLDRLLREAPVEARSLLAQLWESEVPAIEAMRTEVAAYRNSLAGLQARHEFLDAETARRIARQLDSLLAWLGANPDQDAARLIHVAVRYFVEDDDGESDFDSPIGFDDDAEVVEAVARLLGLQELLEIEEATER